MSRVSVDHAPLERSRLPVEKRVQIPSQGIRKTPYLEVYGMLGNFCLSTENRVLEKDHIPINLKEIHTGDMSYLRLPLFM